MPLDTDTPESSSEDPSRAKHGWPRTPDGTIDWEIVFEAPDTGLISLVSAANNHDTLIKVTEKIIRQLFTRKGDEKEVEAFLGELTRITSAAQAANASIEGTRNSIIDLLRRIKTGRIAKAAEYIAEQKAKEASGKRRKTRRRDDDRKLALKQRIIVMSAGGLAAAVLMAGVMGTLLFSNAPPEKDAVDQTAGSAEATDDPQIGYKVEDPTNEQSAAAILTPGSAEAPTLTRDGLEFTALGYPVGTLEAEDIPKLAAHTVTLEPILFGRNVGGGSGTRKFILPVVSLRDPDSWEDICDWGPVITEAITGVMNHQIPQTGDLTNEHMAYAGEVATQMINQRLGAVVADNVFLLHDVNRRMTDARAKCRLVEAD